MFSSQNSQVSNDANYIEDVFSTYLYTGNGSTQTITNGIDLAGKGGLVWCKERGASGSHTLYDTVRGVNNAVITNSTLAQQTLANTVTTFNSTGFALGSSDQVNGSGDTHVSWTFREQPKFFDVVTFTSNSSGGCTFNHSLGASPGFVTIKRTDSTSNWLTYHRSVGNDAVIYLNTTAASASVSGCFTPSSTQFTVQDGVLANSATYVAYLFAHNAGGFGLTGTDNVISCGSFTTTAGGVGTVTLGYEPQWVLIKNTTTGGAGYDWFLLDSMRGMTSPPTAGGAALRANTTAAEATGQDYIQATSTGFVVNNNPSSNYIYIAIRRGPMKVPTSGTSVFDVDLANPGNSTITTTFPVDLNLGANRAGSVANFNTVDRLRGGVALRTSATDAEQAVTVTLDSMNSFSNAIFGSGNHVFYSYKRAPSFMDVVCYSGTGIARSLSHNLQAVPELIIVKDRSNVRDWVVYSSGTGATKYFILQQTDAALTASTIWNDTTPTSTVFTVGTNVRVNGSGANYVAYLFATCSGVSKVGSYTGTGTTKQVDCGFTGGARFVLIKRTDSTGAWYVWDSARGIVAGNDPYLLLNSTAAEVTSTDYVDTYSAGFEISSTAPAAINASGGTFIFLAIA